MINELENRRKSCNNINGVLPEHLLMWSTFWQSRAFLSLVGRWEAVCSYWSKVPCFLFSVGGRGGQDGPAGPAAHLMERP